MPNPYPVRDDEAARVQALRSYDILDTAEQQEFNDLVSLASAICDVPIALISLVDTDRQWFKARVGIDVAETSRDVSFCAHAIAGPSLMEVEDATLDERFRTNPLVLQDPNIRFYAGVPLVPDGEHPFGTICVIDRERRTLSVSQRQALEALARQAESLIELRRLNKEHIRASEQKNAFLRMVGHDLRNPLNYLLGASTMLEQTLSPGMEVTDDDAELLSQMPERARYMTNLINTFLDVQAIEDGGIRLDVRSIDPFSIAEEVVRENERFAGARGIGLVLRGTPGDASVDADPARLRQVLENLVSNAIKFSTEGEVILTTTRRDGECVVAVADSGPGIKDSVRSRLFVPYADLNTRAVGGDQSRGLGLSICKFLVELHGGSIDVRNRAEGGAEFAVRLPLSP